MRVERRTISYLIFFSQGKHKQRTPVVGVSSDEELTSLVKDTFRGRFQRPQALTSKDGVRIAIKKLNHVQNTVKLVLNTTIYNKSVRQARLEIERAIRNQ